MRILGIDPGYERLGIAVIEKKDKQKETLLFSQCFKTSAKTTFHERLYQIGQRVEQVIKEFKPDTLAIETLFFTNNQKTALGVAEVRGLIIYEGKRHKLEISEHTPNQIKTSVTGYGKSDKVAIAKILPLLIKIPPEKKRLDDELDAIAVALTCLACNKNRHLLQIYNP